MQTKLSISPSHSILTPGRPVSALTLYRQAPGRVATGVSILNITGIDSTPEKSRRKRDSNPGSSAPEADALTTRPTRRSQCWGSIPAFRTIDLKTGTLVVAPAMRLTLEARVNARSGLPGVRVLLLNEAASLLCNFLSLRGSTCNCLLGSVPQTHVCCWYIYQETNVRESTSKIFTLAHNFFS